MRASFPRPKSNRVQEGTRLRAGGPSNGIQSTFTLTQLFYAYTTSTNRRSANTLRSSKLTFAFQALLVHAETTTLLTAVGYSGDSGALYTEQTAETLREHKLPKYTIIRAQRECKQDSLLLARWVSTLASSRSEWDLPC